MLQRTHANIVGAGQARSRSANEDNIVPAVEGSSLDALAVDFAAVANEMDREQAPASARRVEDPVVPYP